MRVYNALPSPIDLPSRGGAHVGARDRHRSESSLYPHDESSSGSISARNAPQCRSPRGLDVELRVGDVQALDLPDSSFETVVATLVQEPRGTLHVREEGGDYS
jgi:hypothetical protein